MHNELRHSYVDNEQTGDYVFSPIPVLSNKGIQETLKIIKSYEHRIIHVHKIKPFHTRREDLIPQLDYYLRKEIELLEYATNFLIAQLEIELADDNLIIWHNLSLTLSNNNKIELNSDKLSFEFKKELKRLLIFKRKTKLKFSTDENNQCILEF